MGEGVQGGTAQTTAGYKDDLAGPQTGIQSKRVCDSECG